MASCRSGMVTRQVSSKLLSQLDSRQTIAIEALEDHVAVLLKRISSEAIPGVPLPLRARCTQLAAELQRSHWSRAASEASYVRSLESAITIGQKSLQDCKQQCSKQPPAGARDEGILDHARAQMQQLKLAEQEKRIVNRLDVVLHSNAALRKEVQKLRDKVMPSIFCNAGPPNCATIVATWQVGGRLGIGARIHFAKFTLVAMAGRDCH